MGRPHTKITEGDIGYGDFSVSRYKFVNEAIGYTFDSGDADGGGDDHMGASDQVAPV